jgi:hypothetical protein
VAASSEKLYADALAKNASAAEADASTLLSEAERTEGDAGSATDRMQPRKPSDPDLQTIRMDALSAFGLTDQYAQTAVDLADAPLSRTSRSWRPWPSRPRRSPAPAPS